MQQKSDSVLARVSRELSQLEKRDWELWVIVSVAGVLVGIGFLAILFPAAFLSQGNFRFEVTVSKQLVISLATLLILLNTYLVTRRLELRKMREGLVSATIQNELVRLQSFTDPLTEIYNRRSLDDMATRYIGQARRSHKPLTFLLVDVDRFKQVNTRFGHLTGDFVLAEIAALLKTSVRGSDARSEEHTSELQSPCNLVCRLLLEKKKKNTVNALRQLPQNDTQCQDEHMHS